MTLAFGIYSYPLMFDFAKFLFTRNMGTPDQRVTCGLSWRLVQELFEPDQAREVADRLAGV